MRQMQMEQQERDQARNQQLIRDGDDDEDQA